MRKPVPPEIDLVLLGAGHTHVEVLRRFALRPAPNVRVTLISREPEAAYPAMLPALIRGDYTFEQSHIDLGPLSVAADSRLIVAEASGIDLQARTVSFSQRPPIPFDLLSINVGGTPLMPAGSGVAVKPIRGFLDRLATIEHDLASGAAVAVVGGGASGAELALALACRLGRRLRIVLVTETPDPVAMAPERARRVVRAALVEAGVELVCGVRAGRLKRGQLALSDGTFLEVADAFWATGIVAPSFLVTSGLACDPTGCVRVDARLRSISHANVFAAGDCAAIEGNPRPRAGVWAARAGEPLSENLRRAIERRRLRKWKPQAHALAILGLGEGRAVVWRNGFAASGRLVWRWKDWIDRRWMRTYSKRTRRRKTAEPTHRDGCGAKFGAEVLAAALETLPPIAAPHVAIGPEAPEDAAVMMPPAGQAILQRVDHFRAFVDDPFVFGQVAAAHALSGLHAVGARPWTALATAAVPYTANARMRAELSAMLRGAAEVLQADGCSLVGAHSAEAAEKSLGIVVNGLTEPPRVIRTAGLQVGDALILTKPLGTGILLAGYRRGDTRAGWLKEALDSMRASNATAAEVLRSHDVIACSEVAGFGLAG
ncbi:MAG: selenide, water dikinase SelD, partial [Acetobacteraceae bacterium]|nr:selenide, water dikinase SelD [Acetobacteraceae bacterium]